MSAADSKVGGLDGAVRRFFAWRGRDPFRWQFFVGTAAMYLVPLVAFWAIMFSAQVLWIAAGRP